MLIFLAIFFSYVAGIVSYFAYLVLVVQQPVQDEVFVVVFFAFYYVCLIVPCFVLWNIVTPYKALYRYIGTGAIACSWVTLFLLVVGGLHALFDESAHLLYVFAVTSAVVYQAITESGRREKEESAC